MARLVPAQPGGRPGLARSRQAPAGTGEAGRDGGTDGMTPMAPPRAGLTSTETVALPGGFSVRVTLTGSLFALPPAERAALFAWVDRLRAVLDAAPPPGPR